MTGCVILYFPEASLITLDVLQLIIELTTDLNEASAGGMSQVLSCSNRLLIHLFSKRQSVVVLEHAFAIQRSLVAKVHKYGLIPFKNEMLLYEKSFSAFREAFLMYCFFPARFLFC